MIATRRKLTVLAGMLAMLPAALAAAELPHINLDDYFSDEDANKALQKTYPVGSEIVPVVAALLHSVPEFACVQQDETNYTCIGRSLFRGGFVYVKDWTVTMQVNGQKITAISAKSAISSEKDHGESTAPQY